MKYFSRYVLLTVASFILFAIALFLAPQTAEALGSSCNFRNSNTINCGGSLGNSDDYYYNPVATQKFGQGKYMVFLREDHTSQQIFLDITKDPPIAEGRDYNASSDSFSTPKDTKEVGNLDEANDPTHPNGDPDTCGVFKPDGCKPFVNGLFWPNSPYANRIGDVDLFPNNVYDSFIETIEKAEIDSQDDCVQNTLSFFICPVRDFVVDAADGLMVIVFEQLKLDPLVGPGASDSSLQIQKAFVQFRNIANSLYVIIFLVIIISNFISVGLDNYSIKKMLPRLIAAVIGTQFAFLICSILVDLSNVLLVTIPSLINTGGQNIADVLGKPLVSSAQGSTINSFLGTIAMVLLIIIVAIAAIVVSIIGFVYLLFRKVFLIILILVSPVALAAWVLPQTQTFAKKWLDWFIKLLLMGPIIGFLLAITVFMSNILVSSGDDLLVFAGILIPLLAIGAIPKAFKWSGDIMVKTKDAVSSSAPAQKASSIAKNSAKEGKLAELQGRGMTRFGKRLQKMGMSDRGVRMQARGAYKKNQSQKKLEEAIGSLGFEDQMKIAAQGKGKSKDIAGRLVSEKRDAIQNKNTFSSGDIQKLVMLHDKGGISDSKLINELERLIQQLEANGSITRKSDGSIDWSNSKIPENLTLRNPMIPANTQNGGGPTPPTGGGGPPTGGGGGPGHGPAPTPPAGGGPAPTSPPVPGPVAPPPPPPTMHP